MLVNGILMIDGSFVYVINDTQFVRVY